MKGRVDKVWRNETTDGRKYNVLQINGEKYSLWDEAYFDRIQEGQVLDFDFRESGDFRNITDVNELTEQETSNSKEYGSYRLSKIVKMSCLRSASSVLVGSKIPYNNRADKTLEIARKFENYINDSNIDEETSNPIENAQDQDV